MNSGLDLVGEFPHCVQICVQRLHLERLGWDQNCHRYWSGCTVSMTMPLAITLKTKSDQSENDLDIGSVDADQLRLVRPLLGARLKVGQEPDSEVHLQD